MITLFTSTEIYYVNLSNTTLKHVLEKFLVVVFFPF